MRFHDLIEEVGPLTVLTTTSAAGAHPGFDNAVRPHMPVMMTGEDAGDLRVREGLKDMLTGYGFLQKDFIVVLGAELIFLEVLDDMAFGGEVVLALDSTLSADTVSRIEKNVPAGLTVSTYRMPSAPLGLSPSNSAVFSIGLAANSAYAKVTISTRNLLSFYAGRYRGEINMLDPLWPHSTPKGAHGWVSIRIQGNVTRFLTPKTEGE